MHDNEKCLAWGRQMYWLGVFSGVMWSAVGLIAFLLFYR